MDRPGGGPPGRGWPAGRPRTSSAGAEDRAHPVLDFLFTYYSHPPGRLLRWHPGRGRGPGRPAAADRLGEPFTAEVPARPARRVRGQRRRPRRARPSSARRGDLLSAPRTCCARPPGARRHCGCFGLHEWAMVYRPADGEVRHAAAAAAGRRGHRRRRRGGPGCGARTSTPSASSRRRRCRCNELQPDPGDPARPGAARLPARHDGPLQVGLQARPGRARRAASPTASSWPPRSASWTCAPRPTTWPRLGYPPVADRDAGGQGGVRGRPARVRRRAAPSCRGRLLRRSARTCSGRDVRSGGDLHAHRPLGAARRHHQHPRPRRAPDHRRRPHGARPRSCAATTCRPSARTTSGGWSRSSACAR